MNNTYYSVNFTKPDEFAQAGYMVTDASENVTFADTNGNPLTLPMPCEYTVVSSIPQSPSWGS